MTGRPRSFDPDVVLERAMVVFWQRGYDATGVAELEAATGLGRQSLYGAFGDKRALFARVVDFYFARVLKPGLVDVLDAEGSPRANLERLFGQWIALASAPDFHGCLVGNAIGDLRAGDEEMAALLQRKLTLVEDAFARVLRRAVAEGEVRADLDVRDTARSLVTTAQGLAVVAKVRRDRAFVRAVVAGAHRLLD
ncbi:MAG: TetR family transcriptional regulator [Polyangiales bacterium]